MALGPCPRCVAQPSNPCSYASAWAKNRLQCRRWAPVCTGLPTAWPAISPPQGLEPRVHGACGASGGDWRPAGRARPFRLRKCGARKFLIADMDSTMMGRNASMNWQPKIRLKELVSEIIRPRRMTARSAFEPAGFARTRRPASGLAVEGDCAGDSRTGITLTPGGRELWSRTMRANGHYTALFQAGFNRFTIASSPR